MLLMETIWLLVVPSAFFAALVASVAGTGGGIILLPVLVSAFGVREAVPLYAVILFSGNLSRVGMNWREIDFKVVGWFVLGAVPAAVAGSWLFTRMPDTGLLRILGAFILLSVAWRYLRRGAKPGFPAHRFLGLGAVFSVISGVVGSAGPFLAPFYLSYGLTKGAFIGTEALGTAAMHVTKLVTYQSLGAMSGSIWLHGLALSPVMLAGSYLGKRIMNRIPASVFVRMVEVIIAGFGLWFLLKP